MKNERTISRRRFLRPGARPAAAATGGPRASISAEAWAAQAANANARPELRETWRPELRELLTACWAADAAARPPMKQVVDRLAPLLQPELFTDPAKQRAAEAAQPDCCAVQ